MEIKFNIDNETDEIYSVDLIGFCNKCGDEISHTFLHEDVVEDIIDDVRREYEDIDTLEFDTLDFDDDDDNEPSQLTDELDWLNCFENEFCEDDEGCLNCKDYLDCFNFNNKLK